MRLIAGAWVVLLFLLCTSENKRAGAEPCTEEANRASPGLAGALVGSPSRLRCLSAMLGSPQPAPVPTDNEEASRKTLVVYVYADSDSEYWDNFMYFVREGMKPVPGERTSETDFVVIVQCEDPDTEDVSRYPKLPSNAKYAFHKNECYDWGTYGWLIHDSNQVKVENYTHFIFINCSVRGPFIPSYALGEFDWKSAFLDLITDDVKLVGPVISCEEVHLDSGSATNPHVQSYAVATDQVGLGILMNSNQVFNCHKEWGAAVTQAELASSMLILNAGYNLGSFMLRYQHVNWRNQANWACNAGKNPAKYNMYDGVDINIFEVMFVKFKHSYRFMKVPYVMRALQVERSMNESSIAMKARENSLKIRDPVERLMLAASTARCSPSSLPDQYSHDMAGKQVCFSQMRSARQCFDATDYKEQFPEYESLRDEEVWKQYLTRDQFSQREARVVCSKQPHPRALRYPIMSELLSLHKLSRREFALRLKSGDARGPEILQAT